MTDFHQHKGMTRLSLNGYALPKGTVLPEGLQELSLGGGTLPAGTVLPSTCTVYP
ncbi:MAG: hypothetical protein ACP5RC_05080 [Halothiobacillaceae bacterium]